MYLAAPCIPWNVSCELYTKYYKFDDYVHCTVYADPPGPPQKPGKPRTLKVIKSTKDSLTIEWEAPESDGGVEITHYVVEARQA